MNYLKSRWGEMDQGRRIILLLQPALFLLFLLLYLTYGRQPVVPWLDGTLRFERQGEGAIYEGRVIDGQHPVQFTVAPGPTVEFRLSGELQGTYTVTKDPSAIPKGPAEMNPFGWEGCTGVEIKKDGETWFRGAYGPDALLGLFDEDGTNRSFGAIGFTTSSSVPEPDPGDILAFACGPSASPRGEVVLLLLGLLVGAACALSLLFEDQLFRWNLSFRVQAPYDAEPSEWELFGRWVGWIALTGLELFCYLVGIGLIRPF